jgi:hypothetical protein
MGAADPVTEIEVEAEAMVLDSDYEVDYPRILKAVILNCLCRLRL